MIDFEAIWTSGKLAACCGKTRLEYLWLYGLADANGSFEYDLRAIRSKVAAIRPRVTLRYLDRVFSELIEHGLAFRWHENGKSYLHWTLSDVSGRLPALSARHRYKKFAPDVPKEELAEFESRHRQDGILTASRPGVGVELDFPSLWILREIAPLAVAIESVADFFKCEDRDAGKTTSAHGLVVDDAGCRDGGAFALEVILA